MIRLIRIERTGASELRLWFSDGTVGRYGFARFIAAGTVMTAPLADSAFFDRAFIEAGALAWPNGFDLSAASLHRELLERGALDSDAA